MSYIKKSRSGISSPDEFLAYSLSRHCALQYSTLWPTNFMHYDDNDASYYDDDDDSDRLLTSVTERKIQVSPGYNSCRRHVI